MQGVTSTLKNNQNKTCDMKKEEEILSKITGYSIQELHERLTEPILQPYDCLMAMIEFAEQQVKNLNIPAVIKSICDDYFPSFDKPNTCLHCGFFKHEHS